MRQRLVTILSVLSLLLSVAVIVLRVTAAPLDDASSVGIEAFGGRWTVIWSSADVQVNFQRRVFVTGNNVIFRERIREFGGFLIGYVPGKRYSLYEFLTPWWPLIAMPLILPAIVGVRRFIHRTKRGHCPKCGYNLTGNTSGRCPECGTEIKTAGNITGGCR